jgi:hypothetical protein
MFLYETHLHCYPVSACAESTPEELVHAYKNRGYTGFILTDHFFNGNSGCPPNLKWEEKISFFLSGYERAKKEAEANDFDVFLGWEYAIRGTEFLTYGLGGDFLFTHPDFDKLSIEDYSKLVRDNGGYIAQAHPYRKAPWVSHPFPVAPHLIDGIESFNASQSDEVNQKAYDFARLHNLPIQAGSDAHGIHVISASGIKMRERAGDIYDVITAIKKRDIELIGARSQYPPQ